MAHGCENPTGLEGGPAPACCAVFVVSAAVIGLELALMRCLSVAGWYHFSYLVISTALLGFGASGTFLSFAGRWLGRRFGLWSTVLTLAFAVSVVVSFRAAQALPLDARYVLYSGRHAFLMLLYHLLLLVPFFFAASVIGLALMQFGRRTHAVYAASLLGSGAGGLGMLLLMYVLPEVQLLRAAAAAGIVGAAIWAACAGRRRPVLMAGAAVAALVLLLPLRLRMDPYKDISELQRWEAQGDAQRILTRHSPRARLDVYASPHLRRTLFAGLTADTPPPPQLMILADGHAAGTVFDIRAETDGPILDHTIMSVPYRLRPNAHVLLLGESGGTNVWLARRWGAERVTVVQRDPKVIEIMTGPLADRGGSVLALPGVEVVAGDPRLFVERTGCRYDVIQVVTAEGMAAGVSNLLSLHEDYLLTREGLARCLRRLKPGGLLAVTRGVQSPPRDNVKIVATLAEALESLGVARPGEHVVQFRNYLAATTLASPTPIDADTCRDLLSACRELRLDVEWANCGGLDPSAQISRVPGPEGAGYSYFHYACREILSGRRKEFTADWVYDVRAATDDSPYFYDFFRWRSLPRFVASYGRHWLQRLELGYVVVVAALAEVILVAGVLIVLPLVWLGRKRGGRPGRRATACCFVLLGAAFMLLEMAFILKFTHFLGDPVLSAGVMLSVFLMASGLGSAASRRLCRSPLHAFGLAAVGIGVAAVCYALTLDSIFSDAASWPTGARMGLAVVLTAPIAFLMGWPFPNGLARVERGGPSLVAWAWGANGFASVAAAPLAVLVAVESGLTTAILLAAVLYPLAGVVAWWLPASNSRSTSSMHS